MRPRLVVSADGPGVVSHAGSRLLADLSNVTSLTSAFTDALRPRGAGHDPGRIAVDLAIMLADGGEVAAATVQPVLPFMRERWRTAW
ncbi:hypothetical protein QF030_007694 [Streptomyces rishiriensis]|uniref:Transposase DDE domain-containing protein n=1 Tax=Streptomyces rishiriensis TaxID=68264 RepID=A0ABU0P294_STRRH|nr:hypothetical protein [Streptomyces rishiriensis]